MATLSHPLDFHALAHFFEIMDPLRDWRSSEMNDHEDSKSVDGQFLDAIAILFARAKHRKPLPGKSKSPEGTCPGDPAGNVTATTMIIPKESYTNKDTIAIFVAENDGPQSFDGVSDHQFASELTKWYNDLDKDNLPKDPREFGIWKLMLKFWRWRHGYYVREIDRIAMEWSSLRSAGVVYEEPPRGVIKIIEVLNGKDVMSEWAASSFKDANPEWFKDDWAHVRKLIWWLHDEKSLESSDKFNQDRYINRICLEDKDHWSHFNIERSDFDFKTTDSDWKLLKDFMKAVKYFKLLKTIICV
ncbi:hypothetical protein GGR58DRAFT_525585 [Xylaria digitata]|nr:hypothetical protein GGR58DRAFT_525585 [Xylaria digitata]